MPIHRTTVAGLALAVAASALATVPLAVPAHADLAPEDAGEALDLPSGVTVTGVAGDPIGRTVADVTTQDAAEFNDFPSKGESYVVLSTGDATRVFDRAGREPVAPADVVADEQLSTDVGDDGVADEAGLTLTVAAGTPGASCLYIDYAMGTEEALGYVESSASDTVSIVHDGTEYAVNAGRGYFSQTTWSAEPKPYSVNSISYWHKPNDPLDPEPGTAEEPRLRPVTDLNNVTTRDTARVPIDVTAGDATVTVRVTDANNADLDSVAFVDDVRLGATGCSNGSGVEPVPTNRDTPNSCCGIIRGARGVGNALVYDPVPSTETIERYDAADNGWRSPSSVPVELRFRWYRTASGNANNGDMRKWTPIPHADRQSYVPTAVDRGKVLIVLVTGVVDGRRVETFPSTATADSWFVTLPIGNGTFTDGGVPGITGQPAVGETVTATPVTTTPRQDTFDYQWYARNPGATGLGAAVSGQTGQTMVVPETLAGKELVVRVTAKRASFDSRTFDSRAFGPVQYKTWEATPVPSLVAPDVVIPGTTLGVETGEWAPTPSSYTYQWKRDGAVIPGATSATYVARDDDIGLPITVDVSGALTGYAQTPQTSSSVTPAGRPMTSAPATISGSVAVGATLTGGPSPSGWVVPSSPRMTYEWFAGSESVQRGISRTYKITAADVGKQITLVATASKTGYETTSVRSRPTAVVPKGVLTPGAVRISGVARVGETLKAGGASWRPTPVALTYQWKIDGRAVAGAAGRRSYLRVPRAAKGKRITLVVTGAKQGYATRSVAATTGRVG